MAEFPKNAWYMAGWSEDLAPGLFARRLFGERIVVWRKADSSLAALEDRCPHRFAPLSMGTRDADRLVCGYHGLAFDGQGACVHNPFSERIPAATKVRNWRAEERDGIVWIWGGNPAEADPATIPDFACVADAPGRKVLRGVTLIAAPYEFCADNLMDLSHIEFVHKGTFAGDGVIFGGRHEVLNAARYRRHAAGASPRGRRGVRGARVVRRRLLHPRLRRQPDRIRRGTPSVTA